MPELRITGSMPVPVDAMERNKVTRKIEEAFDQLAALLAAAGGTLTSKVVHPKPAGGLATAPLVEAQERRG